MHRSPARKNDIRSSEVAGDLLRHGSVRASFIPLKPIRDQRDLVRYRKSLVRRHTAAGQLHRNGAGDRQHQTLVGS